VQIRRSSKGREALSVAIAGLNKAEGKVGWFPSAVYPSGEPVAGVAYVQEFGRYARPFMRPTVTEKQKDWATQAAQVSKDALRGKVAPAHLMEAVCLAAEGAIRRTISRVTSPPLKESTIAARKRALANKGVNVKAGIAKPLVHTGLMITSLTSQTGKK